MVTEINLELYIFNWSAYLFIYLFICLKYISTQVLVRPTLQRM